MIFKRHGDQVEGARRRDGRHFFDRKKATWPGINHLDAQHPAEAHKNTGKQVNTAHPKKPSPGSRSNTDTRRKSHKTRITRGYKRGEGTERRARSPRNRHSSPGTVCGTGRGGGVRRWLYLEVRTGEDASQPASASRRSEALGSGSPATAAKVQVTRADPPPRVASAAACIAQSLL